ncbi:MAG: DUF433 domain-containing protein [Proteobacteria bacterium]|nr:DUF433 domain-containing protein [Pseudomonadota bacterium]
MNAKGELLERITVSPDHCGGRPCIRGFRLRVSDVLGLLGAGASFSEILEDYPFLEEMDIRAALEYAALQADHTILIAA